VAQTGDAITDEGSPLNVFVNLSLPRDWRYLTTGGSLAGTWTFRVREVADVGNFVEAVMTVTADSLP
jgi:hypothetical protein